MLLEDKIRDGIYVDIASPVPRHAELRPALFLDRDGVIVELVDYLHRPEDVRLIRGAAQAIASFNDARIPVVVVTNQSGIARQMFTWEDFEATQVEMSRQLAAEGATVDASLACPFHADGVAAYRHPDHPCRKPNPGMVRIAAEALSIAIDRSWIVGDHLVDVQLAIQAGLRGAVHVETGHGARFRTEVLRLRGGGQTVEIANSLTDCAAALLGELSRTGRS